MGNTNANGVEMKQVHGRWICNGMKWSEATIRQMTVPDGFADKT